MTLRHQFRRLPPIARRDEQLRELKRQVRGLERDLARVRAATPPPPPPPRYRPKVASWHAWLMQQQRVQGAVGALGVTDHPRRNLVLKLQNYEIARSYGISTPEVFGVW